MKKTLLLLCAGLLLVGCTNNLTELTEKGVMGRTTGAHLGSIMPDGTLRAAYHGLGATQLIQDPEGNWVQMPGPVAVLSVPLPSGGVGYIISPKDTRIARIEYTPEPTAGNPSIVIEGLEANISQPLALHVSALEVALEALQGMSQTEALATVDRWKEAGNMAPTIANLLTQMISMW